MIRTSKLLSAALGAAAASIVLVATSLYGVGISSDSVWYIFAARSLVNSTPDSPNFLPFAQPPLYPFLLAFLSRITRSDSFDLARAVSAFALGLTVAIGSQALSHFTNRAPLLILGSLALLCSVPLFIVSTMAWTEPIFNLLVLVSFTAVPGYVQNRAYSFSLLTLASAGALLTRYTGHALLLTVAIVTWLLKTGDIKTKLRSVVAYGVASGAPVVAWVSRIWWTTGTPFGLRVASPYSILQNVGFTLDTICHWFLPDILARHYGVISLIVLGVVVVASICAAVIVKPRVSKADFNLEWSLSPLLFLFLYLTGLIGSSTIISYDRIDDRLLSPIYIPCVMVAIYLLDRMVGVLEKNTARIWKVYMIVVVAAALLLYPSWSIASRIKDSLWNGAGGYSTRAWRESPTLYYVLGNPIPDGYMVYSNRPDFLAFFGHTESMETPSIDENYRFGDSADLWMGKWPDFSPAYLVWFESNAGYLLPLEELSAAADMTVIEQLDDGAVYLVSRRETVPDPGQP